MSARKARASKAQAPKPPANIIPSQRGKLLHKQLIEAAQTGEHTLTVTLTQEGETFAYLEPTQSTQKEFYPVDELCAIACALSASIALFSESDVVDPDETASRALLLLRRTASQFDDVREATERHILALGEREQA